MYIQCNMNQTTLPLELSTCINPKHIIFIETQKLLSKEGATIYSQRKIDVEPVFGQIKANLGFTRFNLRGKSKVKTDIGLALMADKLKKYTKIKAIK